MEWNLACVLGDVVWLNVDSKENFVLMESNLQVESFRYEIYEILFH